MCMYAYKPAIDSQKHGVREYFLYELGFDYEIAM